MLEEDILGTKNLILRQVEAGKAFNFGVPFSIHQKVYAKTNENIGGYVNPKYFHDRKSALSVLASGDHVFNMILNGVERIDTFDSNELTVYFSLGIKRSAILKYNYEDYLVFMNKLINSDNREEVNELIRGLFPYMEKEHKKYWEAVIDYNNKVQKVNGTNLNLFSLLLINYMITRYKSLYASDEEKYNLVRERISKTTINFKCADCLDVPKNYDEKYDAVLLSNIPDYLFRNFGGTLDYSNFAAIEENYKKLLNSSGILFASYMFMYGTTTGMRVTNLIKNSSITKDSLKDEEIITFPHVGIQGLSSRGLDGMIISRK